MANRNGFSADFVKSSKKYLILVVSLVGLICLLIGIAATSSALEPVQRWILIVFVIVFATLGFSLSVWLILQQARRNHANAGNLGFDWKASSTEIQRRNLDRNFFEITRAIGSSEAVSGDLFSQYIVAEDLALRQIQQESKAQMLRHQMIGGTDFDAILFKQEWIICIEIQFLVQPDIAQSKINEVLKKISTAKKVFERNGNDAPFRLLLVLITRLDPEGEARLRSTLVEKFSATTIDVDVRLFDFESLQKIYTLKTEPPA